MNRIAAYLVLILLLVIAGLTLWLQSVRHNAAEQSARADTYARANDVLATTLGELDKERASHEQAAIDANARRDAAQRQSAAYRTQLERVKTDHEDLRNYLASRIPDRIAHGMLWPTRGGSPNDQGETPGDPLPADTQTQAAHRSVTHEQGWQWCKDMETAFDLCAGNLEAIKRRSEAER